MKRFLYIVLAALIILPMARAAYAGGPPPKDMLKGIFTSVDDANHTAVFVKDGSGEEKMLRLAEGMTAADVRLNKKVMVSLDKHAGENVIKDISIMFMDMTVGKIIALLIIGLIGGLLSGFIGSGGAFVLTPAMMSPVASTSSVLSL